METEAMGGTASPEATQSSWYTGLDEQAVAFADNKGWLAEDPKEAFQRSIESYKSVEKMVGGRLKIPEAGDQEAWNDLYNRLGRPEAPDQYELNPGEQANEELVDWFKQVAHATGMNPVQAQTIVNKWNEFNQNAESAYVSEAEAAADREINNLRAEWGVDYDENIAAGQRAVQAAGIDEGTLSAMESAIGPAQLLKLFSFFGKGTSEDTFVDGSKIGAAAAKDQLEALKADPQFMGRYMRGEKDAVEAFGKLLAKVG